MTDEKEIAAMLKDAAHAMRKDEHMGWPNLCDDAAVLIERLVAERDALRVALTCIANSTASRFPPYIDIGASGPVKDIARAALSHQPGSEG